LGGPCSGEAAFMSHRKGDLLEYTVVLFFNLYLGFPKVIAPSDFQLHYCANSLPTCCVVVHILHRKSTVWRPQTV